MILRNLQQAQLITRRWVEWSASLDDKLRVSREANRRMGRFKLNKHFHRRVAGKRFSLHMDGCYLLVIQFSQLALCTQRIKTVDVLRLRNRRCSIVLSLQCSDQHHSETQWHKKVASHNSPCPAAIA